MYYFKNVKLININPVVENFAMPKASNDSKKSMYIVGGIIVGIIIIVVLYYLIKYWRKKRRLQRSLESSDIDSEVLIGKI